MYKHKVYHCSACDEIFPIGNEHILQDSCYTDVIHEQCPNCGCVDCLDDVYDDPAGPGKLLVPHEEIIFKWR